MKVFFWFFWMLIGRLHSLCLLVIVILLLFLMIISLSKTTSGSSPTQVHAYKWLVRSAGGGGVPEWSCLGTEWVSELIRAVFRLHRTDVMCWSSFWLQEFKDLKPGASQNLKNLEKVLVWVSAVLQPVKEQQKSFFQTLVGNAAL